MLLDAAGASEGESRMKIDQSERLLRRGSERMSCALMVAVTIGPADDVAGALGQAATAVRQWLEQRQREATHVLISLIDEGERYEPARAAMGAQCAELLGSPSGLSQKQ